MMVMVMMMMMTKMAEMQKWWWWSTCSPWSSCSYPRSHSTSCLSAFLPFSAPCNRNIFDERSIDLQISSSLLERRALDGCCKEPPNPPLIESIVEHITTLDHKSKDIICKQKGKSPPPRGPWTLRRWPEQACNKMSLTTSNWLWLSSSSIITNNFQSSSWKLCSDLHPETTGPVKRREAELIKEKLF